MGDFSAWQISCKAALGENGSNSRHLSGQLRSLERKTGSGNGFFSRTTTSDLSEMRARVEALLPNNASLENLYFYKEMLYEDLSQKKKGAWAILALCCNGATFRKVLAVETDTEQLVRLMTRVLREEGHKSFQLSVAILSLLLILSFFEKLHPLLVQNQCGDLALKIIHFENLRGAAVQSKEQEIMPQSHSCGAIYSESQENNTVGEITRLSSKEEKRRRAQEQLLYGCFQLLLNFAADERVEQKMVKRGIIPLLVDSLNRKQRDLVHVCISFLWKLSVMNKNKDEIVKCGFLSKATHLLQTFLEKTSCTAPTITVLLKTLYNLSFDPAIAADMVDCGILSRVADLVAIPAVRPAAIRVLYQLTIEARGSSLLTFHKSGIPLLLDIAAATPKDACINEELGGVLVNLSAHPQGAQVLVGAEDQLFREIFSRLWLPHPDIFLLEVLARVTEFCDARRCLVRRLTGKLGLEGWGEQLLKIAEDYFETESVPALVIDTFGNIVLDCDVHWAFLCDAGLVTLLHRLLANEVASGDVLLRAIILTEGLVRDSEVATTGASSQLVAILLDLLIRHASVSFNEVLVHLTRCFRRLLEDESTREIVMAQNLLPIVFHRLSCHQDITLKNEAVACLRLLMTLDGDFKDGIKTMEFRRWNHAWIEALTRSRDTPNGEELIKSVASETEDEMACDIILDEDFTEGDPTGPSYRLIDAADLSERDWSKLVR